MRMALNEVASGSRERPQRDQFMRAARRREIDAIGGLHLPHTCGALHI